jgi:hypothetical protein
VVVGAGTGEASVLAPVSTPNVGTNPNPSNGTLTSDDPFSGETNGIPNGLPGYPGCTYGSGSCGGGVYGFQEGPIAIPPQTIEGFKIIVFVVSTWIADQLHIHQPIRFGRKGAKPDIATANAAWEKIKEICAKGGVILDDGHREQWHDEPYMEDGRPSFWDLVRKGTQMFCPNVPY